MKKQIAIILSLTLALSMLLSLLPVSAVSYDWSSGNLPENWREEYDVYSNEDTITATDVLAPVNPNASQEAKNLLAYMCTLTDSQNFLIGQFDIAGDDVTYQTIKKEFGLEPAMYSCHYKVDNTMPTFEGDTAVITNSSMTIIDEEQKTALLKSHYDNGNILLLHSDSAPREICSKLAIQKGLYESEANCVMELDATNPDRDMQVYAVWVRYQESVMAVLKNLEAAGVKAYLWRPWVEFNYHEFSGTEEMGYMAFTRVFQQTVQIAVDAGLTGFLSTYSPGCWGTTVNRNPGNRYVDVYAATMYSEKEQLGNLHANQYSNYDWYVKTGKPIGFAEFSCRSGEFAAVQARGSWFTLMEDLTSYWPNACWFNIWGGLHYSLGNDNGGANGNDDGGLFLDNPFTLHLGEIADYRTGVIQAPGVAQVFTAADTYQGLEERSYTAADLKALGLSMKDMCALRVNTGYAVTFYESSNCTGDGWGYAVSQYALDPQVTGKYKSLTVAAVANTALNKNQIYGSVNDDNAWKANDGAPSVWSGDANVLNDQAEPGTAWLMVDLDEAHTITRYVLKNAGYAGQADAYNTRDFQLQYSLDGENWVTVDTVTGNTASQVSRNIQPVTARYFRLLITGPNSSNIETERGVVTVSEFELFGVPAGLLSESEDQPEEDESSDAEESPEDEEPAPDDQPEDEDRPADDEEGSSEELPADPDTSVDEEVSDDTSDDITDNSWTDDGDEWMDEDTDSTDEDTDSTDEGDDLTSDDTSEEEDDGGKKKPIKVITTELYFPWWAWVLIAVGVAAAVAVVVILLVRRKKKAQETPAE